MKRPIFDTHPHIISAETDRYPLNPLGGRQSDWSRERPASFETLVEQMDLASVDKAVIVHSSTAYGVDNSYVADSVARDTERFGGVFSIDLRAVDATRTFDRWLDMPGMVGLRIYTAGTTLEGQAFRVDDPETYPVWQRASERGVPICMSITAEAIPDIHALHRRFPDVDIILDGFARPDLSDGYPYHNAAPLFSLVDLDRVYMKMLPRSIELASKGDATPQSFFELAVARFGAGRITWGSNYPNNEGTLAELVDACDVALGDVSDADKDAIFWTTALRLYPTLAPAGE